MIKIRSAIVGAETNNNLDAIFLLWQNLIHEADRPYEYMYPFYLHVVLYNAGVGIT